MKRYINSLGVLMLSMLAFTACQVGYIPEGNKEQAPFKSLQDAQRTRESMFSTVRTAEAPSTLFMPEGQADLYHLTAEDGNTLYPYYRWDRANLVNNSDIAAYFGTFATLVKDANYFLMRADEMMSNEEVMKSLSDADKNLLNIYVGEARVLRALGHYRLMLRFSKRYNETNDGGDPGIILMKEYDPLLEKTAKKRATQKQVYEFCLSELEEAAKVIPDKNNYAGMGMLTQDGIPCYLVQDYCYALRSRIFLEMHRYADAIQEVDKFISNYPLGEASAEGLKKLWTSENSSEIMIKTFANDKIGKVGGGLHGFFFYKLEDGTKVEVTNPAWYPNQYLLDLYDKPSYGDPNDAINDLRKGIWFESADASKPHANGLPLISAMGAHNVWVVAKFRGNPALDLDRANNRYSYAHSTHLFDIAEAWLIKAEAEAWSGDWNAAKTTIETLRESRGLTAPLTVTDQEQMKTVVMEERTREMLGMGTRMDDLKRWKQPMDRTGKNVQKAILDTDEVVIMADYQDLRKEADDKMFIWEFPLQDRFANSELEPNW